MTTRLVTILGVGRDELADRYQPVCYAAGGRTAGQTPLADAAITELFGVTSAVAVSTTKAHEVWCGDGEKFHKIVGLPLWVRLIDESGDEASAWKIFEVFQALLTREPIAAAGETLPPDEIILNVTHGFRSQPMLALSAASFVASEWTRLGGKAPRLRVLYGAYDPQRPKDEATPFWDLTDILNASRWNGAIDALIRFGRGDDLAALCKERSAFELTALAGLTGIANRQQTDAALKLGEASKRLADDLALGRLSDALTSSSGKLASKIRDREVEPLLSRLPVLRGAVEALAVWADELRATEVMTLDGVRAGVRLARRLGLLERFAEQAALLRELQATLYHLASSDELLLKPGSQGFETQRSAVDARYTAVRHSNPRSDAGLRVSRLTQVRNDIQHLGLNEQAQSAAKLRAALAEIQSEMEALLTDEGLAQLRTELASISPAPIAAASAAVASTTATPLLLAPAEPGTVNEAIESVARLSDPAHRARCYETDIFPHSAARLLANRSMHPACRLLIVPVGTQPYAPLLVSLALTSTHVALLHTEEVTRDDGSIAAGSRPYAMRVAASLASLAPEHRPAVELFSVGDGIAGSSTLRAVEAAQFWAGDPWPSDVVIDLTGGRKATTAALSAVATIKGCRQVYLEGQQVAPGISTAEVLHTLADLSSLAMADERAAGTALLEAGNYREARIRFERVAETLRASDAADWLRDLSALLEASDGLPSTAALESLASRVGSAAAAAILRAPNDSPALLVSGVLDALRSEALWR